MRTHQRGSPPTTGRAGRLRSFVRRHRAAVAATLAAGAVLFVAAMWWFQPWKLFVDQTVNEALPAPVQATAPPTQLPGGDATPTAEPPQPTGPQLVSSGEFRSLEHSTTGKALVFLDPSGSYTLSFDDLDTSNGPDLVVILSTTPATEDEWGAYDDGEFAVLGALKGNRGDQNYAIPADVDPREYRSAVVWCRRFNVAFGAAPLQFD